MATLVSNNTGRRLLELLNERERQEVLYPNQFKRPARIVLVRCEDASPVSATAGHWGNQFYPATIIRAESETLYLPLGTLAELRDLPVLLTLVGDGQASVVPVVGRTYFGVMTGDVYGDASGSLLGRPRVVCPYLPAASSGGGGGTSDSSSKAPARVATVAAGTLATSFVDGEVIDGISLVTGDRLLIKNQVAQAENGIYVVAASGAPTRATDADSAAELTGATVVVTRGAANASRVFLQAAQPPFTLGTDPIFWVDISGNLYKSGTYADNRALRADGTGTNVQASSVTIEDDGSVIALDYATLYSQFTSSSINFQIRDYPAGTVSDYGSLFGYDWVTGDTIIYAHTYLLSTTVKAGTRLVLYTNKICIGNGAAVQEGVTGTVLIGATVAGGLVVGLGSGTPMADPGDGIIAGSYP